MLKILLAFVVGFGGAYLLFQKQQPHEVAQSVGAPSHDQTAPVATNSTQNTQQAAQPLSTTTPSPTPTMALSPQPAEAAKGMPAMPDRRGKRGSDLSPERLKEIATWTAQEVAAWKDIQKEKREEIIQSNEKIWANGRSGAQTRYDPKVVNSVLGNYSGTFYTNASAAASARGTVELKLNTSSPDTRTNTLRVKAGKRASFTTKFSVQLLGTDSVSNSVNIIWRNDNASTTDSYPYFAFKIPVMNVGQQKQLSLFALNEEYNWQEIGKVDLNRTN